MSSHRFRRQALRAAVLVTVLLSGATAGALSTGVATASALPPATPSGPPLEEGESAGLPAHVAQTTPVANNSSSRHHNPAEVTPGAGADDLQRLLGRRLAGRIQRSTVYLSQDQYEQAQSVLGEEYLEQFEKYADVAGDRSTDADQAVETLNDTRTRQLEYARTVEEFNETYDEFQDARRRGNETRARELGRRLVRLGDRSARLSGQLNEGYDQLETATGSNLSAAHERTRSVQAEINETRELVEREFVATELLVREADERGSFTDPLTVEATLRTESAPVANEQITLRIGARTYTAETNADGAFTVRYRPTSVPVNASSVTIAYVPDAESVYSASNASFPVSLDSVTGQATIDAVSTTAAFGQPVTAEGAVTVAGQPVSGLPLAVVVDGERIGTVQTAADGSFAFEGRLPAGPSPGTQTLTVWSAGSDRAVTVAPATESIRVRETSTTLSATSTRERGTILISGRLAAGDRPLQGRQVAVSLGGESVETVRTGANGSYTARVDAAGVELTRTATVRFDGAGTNLGSAEATVTFPPESAAGLNPNLQSDSPDTLWGWVNEALNILTAGGLPAGGITGSAFLRSLLTSPLGIVAGGLVVGGGGFVLLTVSRWRERTNADTGETGAPSPDASVPDSASSTSPPDSADDAPSPPSVSEQLSTVEATLQAGNTDEAIVGAYGLARTVLLDGRVGNTARTHWQFFEARVAEGADAETLRTLTEAYEVAQYGAESASPALAEDALSAARTLVESGASAPTRHGE